MKKTHHPTGLLKQLFLFMTIVATGMTSAGQDQFTRVSKGSPVPDFSFETTPGVISQISDYKGKVVLITFFATWCGPCRQELPHIDKEIFQPNRKNQGFALLVFGREHDWETVTKFKNDQKFTMPLYPDPERKIFEKFAGQNIPRNFLIGKDGKILFSSVGFNENDFGKLKKEIDRALKATN